MNKDQALDEIVRRWRNLKARASGLNLPPFLTLGLLIAVAVLPFVAFVALQNNNEDPDSNPTPVIAQPPINTSQKVPLTFPFGTPEPVTPVTPEVVEMSPSPEPSPTRSVAPTQCTNGRDDDRDGRIDLRDAGCANARDNSESPNPAPTPPPPAGAPPPPPPPPPASPTPSPPAPPPPPPPPPSPTAPPPPPPPPPSPTPGNTECTDLVDNDEDGLTDGADPGCDPPVQSE